MKIEGSFFKQIFCPFVPVYDKTKKEIVSLSAGKSVDMTHIKQGHNIINYNLKEPCHGVFIHFSDLTKLFSH